jgi:hypothetical protein
MRTLEQSFDSLQASAKAACEEMDRLREDKKELVTKLADLYDWLDDIGDGAPDAGQTARKAMNEAAEIRELLAKVKP